MTPYEKTKQWRADNPERHKAHRRKAKLKQYGLTPDDYNRMYLEQDGCCAICGKHQLDMKQKLAVDHCHKTGNVRGLLCHRCNHGLGQFYDNPHNLIKAAQYLGGIV